VIEFHKCENEVFSGVKDKATYELSFRKKDGTVHDYSLVIVPLKNENNIITGIIEVCFDVTELNMTDAEVKLLAETVAHSSEGIFITDETGVILYVNDAYQSLTGYKNFELVGRTPSVFKSGVHSETFYKRLWGKITKGELWEGIFVNKRKDGNFYREKAIIFPIISEKSKIITNYVAIKRDVTHEAELEEQLRQAQKMEAVGRLAGGIAHDFNNILTSIQGYCEVLMMQTDSSMKIYKPLTEIKKSCKRAVSLTRQLLTFSRKQVFYLKDIELNRTVENMIGMLNRLIDVNTQIKTFLINEKLVIKSDLSMVEQVIMNLVINASDACQGKKGAEIIITTDKKFLKEPFSDGNFDVQPGYYALLRVADNGIGIDEELKQKIFDPFFTTKSKGTGLGLSTVYGIVKQQNGFIQIDSVMGRGTTFNVYFPLNESKDVCLDTGMVKTRNVLKSGSGVIMILEDDDSLRELLETVLAAAGYDIISVSSSDEVYKNLPDNGIDLLLADIILKGERGDDIARKLKEEHQDMKILFISGYVGKTISNVNFNIPDCEFLPKPFSISDLTAKIRQMLNPDDDSSHSERDT
jgi:PAS domain S-box-containing protein